jgi:uncharacterized protein YodC (DUF2158 family)
MAVVNVWTEENPPMTHAVLKLNGYGLGDIQCEWFIGLDKESGWFHPELLLKV